MLLLDVKFGRSEGFGAMFNFQWSTTKNFQSFILLDSFLVPLTASSLVVACFIGIYVSYESI